MTEHVQKRFGVVAGAVAILSALWLVLKPGGGPTTLQTGATVSPSGSVGDPVLFGVQGSPDQIADFPDPTAAAVDSVTGANPASGVAASGDPSENAAAAYAFYNLPPARVPPRAGRGGGCGCRPSCGNKPLLGTFVDGKGNCLSSTPGTLVEAIDACSPGYIGRAGENLSAQLGHWGNDYDVASRGANLPDIPVWQ